MEAALGLSIAQQAPAGGNVYSRITYAEPDDGGDGNHRIYEYDRGRDAHDRHEIRHEDERLLQNAGRDPRAFLDFAGEHRTFAADVEFVVAVNVFIEQAHVQGIADAGGKAIDC